MVWVVLILMTAGIYSCKTPKYIYVIPSEIIDTPISEQDTVIAEVNSDTLEQVDDWVDAPIKSGDFQNNILEQIKSYKALRHGFSGFILHDLTADTTIFNMDEHKYFVAASNTKLLTLYACLKVMQDSLAAFMYTETDSTMTIWGTADPTLMHPDFENTSIINFLKSRAVKKKINLANYNALPPYGQGWMWDDYNDPYQTEITAFPIYGNVLSVRHENNKMSIIPSSPLLKISIQPNISFIRRNSDQNSFVFPSTITSNPYFSQEVPYKYAASVNTSLFGQILNVNIDTTAHPLPLKHLIRYSWPIDTVLKRMMMKSDNMLAEHLLLNAAMQSIDTLNTGVFIKWFKDSYLSDIPQRIFWVDGSGLSRYNRLTPSDILYLLKKLYGEVKRDRLFSLFSEIKISQPAGKKKLENPPVILAKSGSMTGVCNLSGYIITSKGKVLAYSFMNNNFDSPIRDVRIAVAKILTYAGENY